MDLRTQLRTTNMRARQWIIILLCLLMAMVDGYEILVVPLVMPNIAQNWGLDSVAVGYVLSSTVFGMTIGALFLSSIADRIGRRKFIIWCMLLAAVGNVLSGLTINIFSLIAARIFAGLFLGALVPILNTLASEYSSDKQRSTVMGIYGTGLPLGVVLGGMITGWVVGNWGWPGAFHFSAVLSATLGVIAYLVLPESIEFLVERRPTRALESYNKIAAKFGYEPISELPAPRGRAENRARFGTVFAGTLGKRTLFMWAGYALLVSAFYFANTWTPMLIAQDTGNTADGRAAAILMSVGGILGILGFAAMAVKWSGRIVSALLLLLGLPVFIFFSFIYDTTLGLMAAVLVGIVTTGGMQALYAISPFVYPAANRGSALGVMVGLGRGVSITIPIIIGYLFAVGWTPMSIFQVFGVVMLVASILIFSLHVTYRGRTEDPDLVADEDAGILPFGIGKHAEGATDEILRFTKS